VVVDALLWHGASATLRDLLPGTSDRASVLARAALCRLITSDRLAIDLEPRARSEYLRSVGIDHRRGRDVLA
jgi:DNA-directed RNA polymerase beta subunit